MATAVLDFPLDSFAVPEQVNNLRDAVRRFLRNNFDNGSAAPCPNSWMVPDPDFSRRLGQAGYIGMTWPAEYGGRELSPFERYIVIEELLTAGAPLGAHWIADRQTGPLILKLGSEKQKRRYLPGMAAGRLYSCIGLSEPGAGSDLASLRTAARRVTDGWLINGQKIWTTNAHHADVMLTLVRSEAGSERSRGLSQFLIDLSLPGVTVKPIIDMLGRHDFNEVFLDDVLVTDEALLGEEGAGWQQANAELALERSGPERYLSSHLLLSALLDRLRRRPDENLQRLAGHLVSELYTLRLMSMSVAAKFAAGENPMLEAAVVKELGSRFEQQLPNLIQAELDDREVPHDSEFLALLETLLQASLSFSLRGGTREIIRGLIARGLGLR